MLEEHVKKVVFAYEKEKKPRQPTRISIRLALAGAALITLLFSMLGKG